VSTLLLKNPIQTTLDTYSQVAPGFQEAAAVGFDQAFGNKYNERESQAIEKRR